MAKSYLLAVDGGGTKTEFWLADLDGKVLSRVHAGPVSPKSVQPEAARSNLAQGLERVLGQAGAALREIAMSVWGLSGCDSPEDYGVAEAALQSLGFSAGQIRLYNDAIPAFYACAREPGLIAIAGTGSIVFWVGDGGHHQRSGGWGYGFSDLGSGQWLGCEALKQALRYCDGCIPYSPLFSAVARQLGAASLEQLPWIAANLRDARDVAAVCPAVFDCPEDPVAQTIVQAGARYLAEEICACAGRWRGTGPYPVVLAGSLLTRRTGYRDLVVSALRDMEPTAQQIVHTLDSSPCRGGLYLARRALGLEKDDFTDTSWESRKRS